MIDPEPGDRLGGNAPLERPGPFEIKENPLLQIRPGVIQHLEFGSLPGELPLRRGALDELVFGDPVESAGQVIPVPAGEVFQDLFPERDDLAGTRDDVGYIHKLVSSIRRKLRKNKLNENLLRNRRGAGYFLSTPPENIHFIGFPPPPSSPRDTV